jgi:hypothetical protein
MAVTEDNLRAYLRLPPDATEDVSGYLASALSKARTAGIPAFVRNAQYDLFIKSLAAMYYENRSLGYENGIDEDVARRLINSFVIELRYATEDPDPEGGGDP